MESTRSASRSWAIDSLRTCAVLGVVAYHAVGRALDGPEFATRPATVRLPVISLDLFFVISGYLVWKITRVKEPHALEFLAHRFTRIWPLYALATLACAAQLKLTDGVVTASAMIKSLLFLPKSSFPVVPQGWTLDYDMYFFLLFAFVLLLPRRRQLIGATVLFALPVVFHVLARPHLPLLYVYTHPRLLGFLAGLWVAEATLRARFLPRRLAQTLAVGGVAVNVSMIVFRVNDTGIGQLPWLLIAVTALMSAVSIEATGAPWCRIPFSRQIGDWSYAIYLVQFFAIDFVFHTVRLAPAMEVGLSLGASILLGWLAHALIERPLSGLLKRHEAGLGRRARTAFRRSVPALSTPSSVEPW